MAAVNGAAPGRQSKGFAEAGGVEWGRVVFSRVVFSQFGGLGLVEATTGIAGWVLFLNRGERGKDGQRFKSHSVADDCVC